MTASLRLALAGADLLGFASRTDAAPSAKPAFVGLSGPQFPSGGNGGAGNGGTPGRGGYVTQDGQDGAGNSGGGGGGVTYPRVGSNGGAGGGAGGSGGQGAGYGAYTNSSVSVGNAQGDHFRTATSGQAGGAGGGGGGGGGGGIGVLGANGAYVTVTVTGAVSGSAAGAGGAGGAVVNGVQTHGGDGGRGGAGVLASFGQVTVNPNATVTGGRGGDGGAGSSATAAGHGGDGGGGVVTVSNNKYAFVANRGALTGGQGGGGPGLSGTGGAGVSLALGTVSNYGGGTITGGAGGANGGGGVGVGATGLYNYGAVAGGAGGATGDGGAGVVATSVFNYGSVVGGAETNAAGNTGGAGISLALIPGNNPPANGLLLVNLSYQGSAPTITGGAGAYQGGAGVSAAANSRILNYAAITGGGGGANGQGGAGVSGAGALLLTNTGTITGGASGSSTSSHVTGAGVYLSGSGNTVTNSGTITAGMGGRYGLVANGATVTNTGTIAGGAGRAGATTGATSAVALGGTNVTIVNSGAITGGAGANGSTGFALEVAGTSALTLSTSAGTGRITGGIGVSGTLSIDPGVAASVTLANTITDGFFGGLFAPPGAITKIGANTLVLTGADTYTGATTVSAGTLEIGQGGSLTSAITVNAGTLRGVGSTTKGVTVASGGTFAPGNAAGTGVFTIGSTGINASAPLSLPNGATFTEVLTSATAYGSVNIAGPVTLGGALNLSIAPGAVLPVGTVFTLIHERGVTTQGPPTFIPGGAGGVGFQIPGAVNTTYPAVSGTFAGHGEGTTYTAGAYTFTISYKGGANGDDVTLTETAAPNTPPTVTGTHPSQTSDRTADALFNTVAVVDPDAGQTETATISFNSANGTLNNAGGYTVVNGVATYRVTAASAGALSTALQAVTFQPTTAPANTAPTPTTFSLSVSDGTANSATDTNTVVTVNHATNVAPTITGTHPSTDASDRTADALFTGVTVSDPDLPAQTETATISFNSANGTLNNAGGYTLANGVATYKVTAASAGALSTALQAVTFQPTTAPPTTAPTPTTFSLTVSDGVASSATDMNTVVTVNHATTTAPTINGVPTTISAPSGGSVLLAPGLTITDPDANPSVTSAQLAIGGFVAGDRLTIGAAPAGVTPVYNPATGVLTLTGNASDGAYAQVLETVSFSHDGTVNAGQRTVSFTVTDNTAMTSTPATETVNVGGYIQPTTGGGGGGGSSTVPTNLDVQQQFPTQTDNLLRVSPNDPALSDPLSSLFKQLQAEKGIAAQLDNGQISLADAQNALYHLVDGTTSVAEISYSFFTGATPSSAGLNYLVHSSTNSTDLNDAYYGQFTTENRYINFAANLATGQGAGAAAFQANYGSLSLQDATAKAYAAVFGTTPASDKISAILNAQVSNGLGGTETRAQYFADITGGSAQAQKAAAIGFLLADSVKEGFGAYQQADLHFLQDLAHGTAVFNVDLIAAYTQAPSLVGQPVLDPTLGG